MSIPVDLADLASALEDFDDAYLLTTSGGAVKAVRVPVHAVDGGLRIAAGSKGSTTNLDVNPQATLLFPPRTPKGMSLIVDGTASPDGDGFTFTPTTAILHRPARHADGEASSDHEGCGNDCRHL